jgi:hypothetical protein
MPFSEDLLFYALLDLTFVCFFLIVMNNSQNPLYPKQPMSVAEQNKG